MPAPIPLPDDPVLAAAAAAMQATRSVGEAWDADWRLAYVTEEYALSAGGGEHRPDELALGEHLLAPATIETRLAWRGGPTLDAMRAQAVSWGGMLLAPQPGAREELLAIADPRLHEALAGIQPTPMPAAWADRVQVRLGSGEIGMDGVRLRLLDVDGRLAGSLLLAKPAVRGAVLGMLALGDERLFDRMLDLATAGRRPVAIVFADLEASTALSRRLSAAGYFGLVRRLARVGDDVIVSAGGVVGKHAGDGMTAFFLAGEPGGESAAAAAAIGAVRALRAQLPAIAERSGLAPDELVLRFGVHWGATVQVGRLLTAGRIEVTAIGDEVNEAARIEACATGGRALASKALVERLNADDARASGVEPGAVRYVTLSELPTASEKARRDAPAVSVCEL